MEERGHGDRAVDRLEPTTRAGHTDAGASCAAGGDFRRVCPNCGATLRDKECKSRCPRCHFFTDCSDPW
jgi:rubrerythrin